MSEEVTPSLLSAFETCKDLQLKLTSTISTLEDHNDFLTDRCIKSAEQLTVLHNRNAGQEEALLRVTAENVLLRSKVNALQQYQEFYEEIRKEVASLRRTNMQLESKQSVYYKAAQMKTRCMEQLSDKQSITLQGVRDKGLKTASFMNWLKLLINKNQRSQNEPAQMQKLEGRRSVHQLQTVLTVKRELVAKCDELDLEKRNVHKLSNRVRQLAQVIADLQEQHNSELEMVVENISRENIKLLGSAEYMSNIRQKTSPDTKFKQLKHDPASHQERSEHGADVDHSYPDMLSKLRMSLSPSRPSPDWAAKASEFQQYSQVEPKLLTIRSQTVSSEQVELAIRECQEMFSQMAKQQCFGGESLTEDRRHKFSTTNLTTQSVDPHYAVDTMLNVIINVFAKWKLHFPFKKVGATCYEWKGKKWHLAVQSHNLKTRVGAGYEELLPILTKELVRNGLSNSPK
jgi:exonuclease VII small subunit